MNVEAKMYIIKKSVPLNNQPMNDKVVIDLIDQRSFCFVHSCLFLLCLLIPVTGITPFIFFFHIIFTFARDAT